VIPKAYITIPIVLVGYIMRSNGHISKKCYYALKAIFELALRNREKPVKVQDIAIAQGISAGFLELILVNLRQGGFVESRRGSEGGYMLLRDPVQLTVGEVIRFVEGQEGRYQGLENSSRTTAGDYAFSELWKRVSQVVWNAYDSITFGSLIEQEMAKCSQNNPDYCI